MLAAIAQRRADGLPFLMVHQAIGGQKVEQQQEQRRSGDQAGGWGWHIVVRGSAAQRQ